MILSFVIGLLLLLKNNLDMKETRRARAQLNHFNKMQTVLPGSLMWIGSLWLSCKILALSNSTTINFFFFDMLCNLDVGP